MSNYVELSDITVETYGLSDDVIQSLIDACEVMVNWVCQDIFYVKSDTVIKFTGDGTPYHFLSVRPYIIEIDKIEFVESDSTLTLIDSSYYQLSDVYLVTRVAGGVWSRGRPFNYKITCSVGRAVDDDYYKPGNIKLAVIGLVANYLNEFYGENEGTSGIAATPMYKFTRETITNWTYVLKDMSAINLESDTPFGIPYVDNLIAPFRIKTMNVGVVSNAQMASIKTLYLP